jgi:hypothetical protein
VSIITYKSLFARFARSLAKDESNSGSKRLKFETSGAPTIYLAYTIEDWDLASPAADALAGCGVDIHADWTLGRLFTEFDDEAAILLRTRLSLAGSWLVVLVSERTPPGGRIQWVLELARETLSPARFAVLPVHHGTDDWSLPRDLAGFPRIEEKGDDLCVTGPAPGASLLLHDWLRHSPPA